MNERVRRWLLPLLAAGAVLAVVAGIWLQRPGGGSDELGPAAGGGGGDSPPYSGSEPGNPGPDGPVPLPDMTTTPEPGVSAPRHLIAVNSYYRYDARHLALNYTNGVPECYGSAGDVRVEESSSTVTVTIPRVPPSAKDDEVECIEIAMLLTLDITLDEPLGDRVVLDGSRDGTPVEEAEEPYVPAAG